MVNLFIKFILILLLVFTPVAFGSVELWAFSLMELAILLIIVLWAIQKLITPNSERKTSPSAICHLPSAIPLLLSLFFLLILFQLLPLPSGFLKILSPKTYELRSALSLQPPLLSFPLSFFSFATRIEFFKWLTFAGLFIFLLCWKPFEEDHRIKTQLVMVILLVGITESLYGMFEFFSGHRYILHLNASSLVSSVTGTFINRNAFAGYLLMVIPLSIGFLFSREAIHRAEFESWRHRLSTLDGKALLMAFGIIVMILGLLFSASRMGIVSLLLSFSLMTLLLRSSGRGRRFSGQSILILGLALIWAIWIGLDAVISRFFAVSEDFEMRRDIWIDTFKILKDFPIFGSGLGTFHQVFPVYRSFHIRGVVTHAENDFLQLASEVGLLGIGLLIVLFITLFYKAVSGIRSLSFRDEGRYISAGGMVGILALMFHSTVERNLQIPANAFLFIFIWSLVIRIGSTKRDSRS